MSRPPCASATPVAPWPTVTLSPIRVGSAAPAALIDPATCTTAASWMFESLPIEIELTSPRRTALYQTEDRSPTVTSPMTEAEGATKAEGARAGDLPACGTTVRWVGTVCGVFFFFPGPGRG